MAATLIMPTTPKVITDCFCLSGFKWRRDFQSQLQSGQCLDIRRHPRLVTLGVNRSLDALKSPERWYNEIQRSGWTECGAQELSLRAFPNDWNYCRCLGAAKGCNNAGKLILLCKATAEVEERNCYICG